MNLTSTRSFGKCPHRVMMWLRGLHGTAATAQEIADATGYYVSTVYAAMTRLRQAADVDVVSDAPYTYRAKPPATDLERLMDAGDRMLDSAFSNPSVYVSLARVCFRLGVVIAIDLGGDGTLAGAQREAAARAADSYAHGVPSQVTVLVDGDSVPAGTIAVARVAFPAFNALIAFGEEDVDRLRPENVAEALGLEDDPRCAFLTAFVHEGQ